MIKQALLFISFIALYCATLAQPRHKIDSIRGLLSSQLADTARIKILNDLAEVYWRTATYDSAMTEVTQAVEIGDRLSNSADKNIAGSALMSLARSYKIIGVIYRHLGNFGKALEYDNKALVMNQSLGNKSGIAATLGNIGVVYWSMDNYAQALDYYKKALAIAQEIDDKMMIASNVGNIGILYRIQGKDSEALVYDRKAAEIESQIGDISGVANNMGNIGVLYMHQGRYDSSLAYTYKALAITRRLGEKVGIAVNYDNLGSSYTAMKKYGLAKAYIDSALKLSSSVGEADQLKSEYEHLYELDSNTGNYRGEAEDYKKFVFYRDSLQDEFTAKKTIQAEINFEFERKLAAGKAAQDKKDALALQERRRQSIILDFFITGFILLAALAFFIFRGYRQKKRANITITEQKKIVEEQKAIVDERNKDMTDSIRYASRIQHALMTTDEYIGRSLKDHFIYFRPRDIVSGDFYWAFQDDAIFYIACCDCTGHGVPGAFMSLLNISMLNEAVVERKIKRPDEALNNVRSNVIKALNPEGKSETKDGMDCALISIDIKNNRLQAACANNPVWIIREGMCIELKEDKMPVGIQDAQPKPFTLNAFEIKKGDCMYLFTDGYADQFGGPGGKKFKNKQFKELLLANANKPMEEQKEILDREFNTWKGSLDQVDDVLVIGIRI